MALLITRNGLVLDSSLRLLELRARARMIFVFTRPLIVEQLNLMICLSLKSGCSWKVEFWTPHKNKILKRHVCQC